MVVTVGCFEGKLPFFVADATRDEGAVAVFEDADGGVSEGGFALRFDDFALEVGQFGVLAKTTLNEEQDKKTCQYHFSQWMLHVFCLVFATLIKL